MSESDLPAIAQSSNAKPTRRRLMLQTFVLFQIACVAMALVSIEIYIRYTGKYASYFDKNGLPNVGHETETLREPWLWVNERNSHWVLNKREFTQESVANAEGLVGELPPIEKKKNEIRIVVMGDSFTEGVGDLKENGFPAILQRLLNQTRHKKEYTVINGGVSGSDPVFELELLKRRLLKFKPDIVILAINKSDIDDLVRRGGFDRFNEQGFLKSKNYPFWSWFFDHSHLVRLIVLGWLNYDWELNSPAESARIRQSAIEGLVQSGVIASQIAKENSFKLLVIVHPFYRQILDPELYSELRIVEAGLQKAQVNYAGLLNDFISEIPGPITREYYWTRDSHFKHKGYEIFARVVLKNLEQKHMLE